ncbi:hypothetical protein IKE67_08315 [bacterium]|nr:hypothetical protein [bacterium]
MQNQFIKLLSCLIPSKKARIAFRAKFGKIPLQKYGVKHVYNPQDSQDIIINELSKGQPCMICRFGGTEMRVVDHYLKNRNKLNVKFPEKIKEMIGALSGFFPSTDYLLSRFSSEFIELAKDIDVLAVWNTKSEKYMCENYLNKNAKLIHLFALNTVSFENPWSQYLQGKKVLVIHPFAETIEKQYKNREKVFAKNPKVLPQFELITMKPVQGLADSRFELPYENWFEALNDMKSQISKIDFDIAVIGAGAYGIFLAHYCKELGKQAVHLGGATQLLFGITGKRWDVEQAFVIENVINEHWVRPDINEQPKGVKQVEGGCYW